MKISVEDDACIVIEPVRADSTLKARMEQWDGVRCKNAGTDWNMSAEEEIWRSSTKAISSNSISTPLADMNPQRFNLPSS